MEKGGGGPGGIPGAKGGIGGLAGRPAGGGGGGGGREEIGACGAIGAVDEGGTSSLGVSAASSFISASNRSSSVKRSAMKLQAPLLG